ncbi:MAG: uroporphyrinogen decarboxylase family protein [Anaerolineae bacterium]
MTKWNKRQRLEAAIAGEAPDRIPVALWRHWPGDDQDAEALAAAHLQWQRDYDWDLLKVGPSSSYSVVDWGVRDHWVGHIEGTREYTHRPIQQPADWEKLAPLDPYKGMLATQLKALRLIGEDLGGNVPFIITIFAPLSQAKHLADNQVMLSHLRAHPDTFRRGLETITESTIRFIEAAKTTGISGIYYAIQHARYPQMSPAEYEMWGRPYDLQILEAASDLWLNVLHIHSSDIMFDELADYPAAFVNWHDRETGISLRRGLEKIKGAASGGVDHWTLHQESPEQMLEAGCVAMVTTPLRNIRALRESVE